MNNQALVPTNPPKYAVPHTYANNYIPVDSKEVKILINGSDLILITDKGEQLILTMGAELASLSDGLIRLKFKDGVELNSQEILDIANIIGTPPNVDANNLADNQTQQTESIVEEIIQENVIEDIIVLNGQNTGGGDQGESSEQQLDSTENIDVTLPKKLNTEDEPIAVKKTSGDQPKPDSIIVPDDNDITVTPSDKLAVSLLQVSSHVDNLTKTVDIGFGNDDARQDASVSKQYQPTVVDLSSETQGWKIDALNDYYQLDDGKMARVVRLDDASNINSVTGAPAGYQIIKYGDPEAAKYGLAENEIVIIYPQNSSDIFELHFDFTDLNGSNKQDDFGFRVVDSPSSLTDNSNNILLSKTPNSVHVKGGSDNDTIIAGYGKDIYEGGGGNLNTVDYSNINGSLTIDLTKGTVTGGVDHQLNDIQKIIGSDHGNTMIGAEGIDNTLIGGAGDDFIIGNTGNNTLDGGVGGIDTLSYQNSTGGVNVDLSTGIAKHGNSQEFTDLISNFENVIGSNFDDVLIGSTTGNNQLNGGAGNDILMGMNGFNILDGGSGINTASYEKSTSGITIDLRLSEQQVTNNGFGGKDTLINIQQIIGSNKNDLFYIGKGNTIIDGAGGNDRFDLIGTDDNSRAVLTGGKGNNTFIAGKGYNKFIGDASYSASSSNTVDYSRATDTNGIYVDLEKGVVYRNGFGGVDQVDHITGIVGTDYDDRILLGSKGNQTISTGAGNDTIIMNGSTGYTNIIDGGSVADSHGNPLINTVDYSNANSSVIMSYDYVQDRHDVSQNGFGGNDYLSNIHNIIGSKYFNDVLEGNSLNNKIITGDGDNTVFGSLGDDILEGGSGLNTLDYSHLQAASSLGVTINTLNNTVAKVVDGTSYHDSYANFNRFVGSSGDDLFIVNKNTKFVSGGVDNGSGTGFDKVDFSHINNSLTIDLKNGFAKDSQGNINIGLENIDSVKVSDNGHIIFGNDNNNVLEGGNGNDRFTPGKGSNTVNGGGGTDWISYDDYTTGVNVDLNNNGFLDGTASKNDGIDTLTGITHIRGSKGDDTLAGGGYLAGGAGNNTLIGYGDDAYAYYNDTGAVVVDLRANKATNNGMGEQDTLVNINNVIGSSYNDRIYGNDNDNIIKAGAGNDNIYGSLGNDTIDGGLGNDTLDYSTLANGHFININLTQNAQKEFDVNKIQSSGGTPVVGQDAFTNINNIIGSKGNDIFTISDSMELYAFGLIDGGGGNANSIQKSSSSDSTYFQLSQAGNLNLKNIQVLDFQDGKAVDTVAIDLNTLFQNYASGSTISLKMDIGDIFQYYGDSSGWNKSVSGNQETWYNDDYTFICNYA